MTQIPSLPPPVTFQKGGRTYRRWTKEHKRQIVEESFAPGVSVSIVARRHDVNTNQVFKWRDEYERGELGCKSKVTSSTEVVQVGVIGQDGRLAVPSEKVALAPAPVTTPATPSTLRPATLQQGIIEVVLRQGIRVRMKGNVDLSVLNHVITTAAGLP